MAAPVALESFGTTTRLTCRAPHATQRGKACGGPLGDIPGSLEYVTHSDRAPDATDGFVWLRCTNCRRWNKWEVVAPVPTVAVGSVQERLAKFPEIQQQTILALAGGISKTQTSQTVGVDRRTITRWMTNPEFMALRREIAPSLTEAHTRVALAALFALMENDVKKGSGTHIRYFLNRTYFAEFEKQKSAGKGTAINLNVAQHQQQTQATVKQTWEDRQRAAITPVAPTE